MAGERARLGARLATVIVGALVFALAWAGPVAAGVVGPAAARYTFQAPGGQSTMGKKVIALTFDDGPGPYTPEVLSVLQHYGVPATFFEVGIHTLTYPQFTQQLALAGYPVEDHTWTHADLATLPISQYPFQIDQTQNRIRSLTGLTPSCVRPPYNDTNTTVLQQLAVRGLTTMGYSVDPRDWSNPGTQTVVARVVGAAFPGAVVDLHDGGGNRQETVDALPQIITGLRGKGYSFVSICDTYPVQMLLDGGGGIWAKNTGPAMGGWAPEAGAGQTAIAVGSDGTQMLLDGGGQVWAKDTVGAGGWAQETPSGQSFVAVASGGGVQMVLDRGGEVWAKNTGPAMGGWAPETGPGEIAITAG